MTYWLFTYLWLVSSVWLTEHIAKVSGQDSDKLNDSESDSGALKCDRDILTCQVCLIQC